MTRPSAATVAIASLITEKDWQRQVTDAAELFGWSWAHFRPAMTSKGWRTPVSGPLGAGFPDLILCRGDRLILVELKAEGARLSPPQRQVHAVLSQAVPLYTWRPSDLPAVLDVLGTPALKRPGASPGSGGRAGYSMPLSATAHRGNP